MDTSNASNVIMSEEVAIQQNVVEMHHIIKHFPGVLANDRIDFSLRKGEIHALLGENGAGKSTLMNILAGLYKADTGTILIKGEPISFVSPRDAIESGIGMVHQHFMLVPSQTVTENILLGLNKPRFVLNLNEYHQIFTDLSKKFGLFVDPRAKIWQLSVGEQQRVEILKILYRGAEVLIMDEPTAVLAPTEINDLFATLRAMLGDDKSIIFITHKLQEVMDIADRVTVLSKGKVVAAGVDIQSVSKRELARLMVGRDVLFYLEKKEQEPGQIVLSIEDVFASNDKGLPALKGVSLNVRAGEIVGLAGVAGNGQRELSQVIGGLRHCEKGRVLLSGLELQNNSPRVGIQRGLAYVPEDRTNVGTSPNLSVTDNLIMKKYRDPPICQGWLLNMSIATEYAEDLKDKYEIIVPTVDTPARLLSGGNLQRLILAREISGEPSVLIAVQPTRGLDVGAIEGVQKLLLSQREAGGAVLLISDELDELLTLSDRIFVIYEGMIMGEILDGDVDAIGLMMTGTPLEEIQSEVASDD
jgi:ABC-type uncharacterized transport system ATPase subunit